MVLVIARSRHVGRRQEFRECGSVNGFGPDRLCGFDMMTPDVSSVADVRSLWKRCGTESARVATDRQTAHRTFEHSDFDWQEAREFGVSYECFMEIESYATGEPVGPASSNLTELAACGYDSWKQCVLSGFYVNW